MAQIFLPKMSSERKLNIRTNHIFGLVLIAVLMMLLTSAFGMLARSIAITFFYEKLNLGTLFYSNAGDLSNLMQSGNLGAMMTFELEPTPVYYLYKAWTYFNYAAFVLLLTATIFLLLQMKKFCKRVATDTTPLDNPVRVKKGKYVWLGFLLGAFGAHLFAIGRKKKAWIFFGLGLGGMVIPILILYTTGISFADAYMACFIEKDAEGMITIEDYPWWI